MSIPSDPDTMPKSRTVAQRFSYALFRTVAQTLSVHWYELHAEGRENFPRDGGGLILSTHQSVLDPVLVGQLCNRRLNYLARKTLFRSSLFAAMIRHLDAIEIDREGGGLFGLKETLTRLRRGELVLMFPEGTRTTDGQVQDFKPGFISIARRAGVPLVPVAIVGAFDVLPKGKKFPRRRTIKIVVGKNFHPDEIKDWTDKQLMVALQERIEACHARGEEMRDYCSRKSLRSL
jgi:1-acyl-sn-glycerol-3-phosphate acyltransferase